jgi:two-component system sensor histidine kinase FlrB
VTPKPDTAARRESLEAAFHLFNRLSEELTGSYQQLQQQVLQLSKELAATRTERMLQLTEKERLADRLERLLETLPAAVILLDEADRVSEFNPAASRLLPSIALGDEWERLLQQQTLLMPSSCSELHLRNGKVLNISSSQLEQTPGRILVMLDVTETRKLQERLNRQERLGAMGEMSAQLAHQMRTPLSTALLYTSHLGNDNLTSAQRRQFTDKLRARLQHMERQIGDILMFARGSESLHESLSLVQLLEQFDEISGPEVRQAGVCLHIEQESPGPHTILGRRDALLGALANLADNALHHGAKNIWISLQSGDQIRLRFSDDGSGIPAEYRKRIFDPFFTTRGGGTGLGLAVVQNLMLSHHGEIRLCNAGGQGASFELTFPCATDPEIATMRVVPLRPTQGQARSHL